MLRRPCVWLLLAACLTSAACGQPDAAPPEGEPDPATSPPVTGQTGGSTPPAPQPREQPPDAPACRHDGLETGPVVLLTGTDPTVLATRVARRTHRCVEVAVVAVEDGWAPSLAVPVAIAEDAPLLLVHPDDPDAIGEVLAELDADRVIGIGVDPRTFGHDGLALVSPVGSPRDPPDASGADRDTDPDPDTDPDSPDADPDPDTGDRPQALSDDVALALTVADHLDVRRFVAAPEQDARSRSAAALLVDGTAALLPVPADSEGREALARQLPAAARLQVVDGGEAQALADELLGVGLDAEVSPQPRWPEGGSTAWLIDPDQPAAGAVAAVAAAGRGETVLPMDATDLRAGPGLTARIREAAPSRAVVLGEVTPDAQWQLELVRDGRSLPGGGFRLFDDQRMVALSGSPVHGEPGALGEQDLDATVERLLEAIAPYGADSLRVLPAFELIATVASVAQGTRGDHSERTEVDALQPYVERAAEEGFYVILGLQPGHADPLEQAQEYEQLLLEPHVGLALDPGWRIDPDEVDGEPISPVEVEEVQRVADWLAELTREQQLPQKLLVLHRFTAETLPDRDQLEQPAELAVVIHVDGQGDLAAELETYASITHGAADDWIWGWTNRSGQDEPVASPDEVVRLEPAPLVITYR